MWWLNVGLPVLAGGATYLWKGFSRNHRRLQIWQTALAQCKLTEMESSGFWSWRATLTARSGPLTVRLTNPAGEKDRVFVEIEGAAGFSLVKLRRQFLKLWTREIELGDEAFDDKLIVDGQIEPLYALLDATMRRLLVRACAVCNPLEIGDGRLRVKVSEGELPHILPLLFDISRRFGDPLDAKGRITRNARHDPKSDVRLANLLLLVREHPGDPDTLKALRRACSDVNPKVRVRAAIELGEEGRDVLLKIVEKSSNDAASALAVSHLGGKLTFERANSILARALRKGFSQTARACLEVLGHRRAAAIGTLVRVMTEEKGELATAAALALGSTGEEAAEPPLLQALQSDDSPLREAAAAALGKVGSAEAVQPLKEAAERFWLDLGLRRAARQAVAEIQSRLGASPGQLSLAEAEAGQLSLAQADPIGHLSLSSQETEASQRPRDVSGVRQA